MSALVFILPRDGERTFIGVYPALAWRSLTRFCVNEHSCLWCRCYQTEPFTRMWTQNSLFAIPPTDSISSRVSCTEAAYRVGRCEQTLLLTGEVFHATLDKFLENECCIKCYSAFAVLCKVVEESVCAFGLRIITFSVDGMIHFEYLYSPNKYGRRVNTLAANSSIYWPFWLKLF